MENSDAATSRLVGELREVVHAMNNALTPILANAQLARLMIEDGEAELEEILDDVVEAAGRAGHLVVDMRRITQSLEEALPAGSTGGEVLEGGVGGDSPGH